MRIPNRLILAAPLAAAVFLTVPGLAQNAMSPPGAAPAVPAAGAPARANGIIEKVEGSNLIVKTAMGDRMVTLSADATVIAVVKARLADIKPGVFVGVGATPLPDGSQQAIRVMLFPESMRGVGEGFRPWDRPNTTMTNGTVDAEGGSASVDGQVLKLKYKGGEQKIVIRPDASILALVPGDKADLKAGANIMVSGTPGAGGAIQTNRVTVARDGVVL